MPDLTLDELIMLGIRLDKLKLVVKSRGIKGDKIMSQERLLRALNKPKLTKINFDNERLKKIREDLNKSRHKYSKSEKKKRLEKVFTKQRAKKIFQHKK